VGHIEIIGPAHSIIGCGFSRVVEEVEAEANDDWKVGD